MKTFKTKYKFTSSTFDILQSRQPKDSMTTEGGDFKDTGAATQQASEVGKNYININREKLSGKNADGEYTEVSETRYGTEYDVWSDQQKITERRGRILTKVDGVIYDIDRNNCKFRFTDQKLN